MLVFKDVSARSFILLYISDFVSVPDAAERTKTDMKSRKIKGKREKAALIDIRNRRFDGAGRSPVISHYPQRRHSQIIGCRGGRQLSCSLYRGSIKSHE